MLAREFFARPAIEVAPDLLGCVIAHQTADGLVAVWIAETEAYAGERDPASHAFRGRTARKPARAGSRGSVREPDLARGPARLCQALGIDRSQDGADVCDPAAPLRVLAPAGASVPSGSRTRAGPGVRHGPRGGVGRAAGAGWGVLVTRGPTP